MKRTASLSINSAGQNAEILCRSEDAFTLQIRIPYSDSMLKSEELIQHRLNEAGVKATQEALSQFDTDGSPIQHGPTTFFSKGKEPKEYQTPYGPAVVDRHVYQSAKGGKTFCPLVHDARIIITSTPKFAKTVSSKYSDLGGSRVQVDLKENHGRSVARSYIQITSVWLMEPGETGAFWNDTPKRKRSTFGMQQNIWPRRRVPCSGGKGGS